MEAEQHNTPTPEISIVPDADPIEATDFPKGDDLCLNYLQADRERLEARKAMMQMLVPGIKISRKLYDVRWRCSQEYLIEDLDKLSDEFLRRIPDKEKISKALLEGREVSGVSKKHQKYHAVVKPKGKLKKRRDAALK
jgi:hypothetical protein